MSVAQLNVAGPFDLDNINNKCRQIVYRRIESSLALERSKNRDSAQQVSQPEPQITGFPSSSRFGRGPVTLDVRRQGE